MEWYFEREGELFALNDQVSFEDAGAEDRSPLLSDWCQWGFSRPEKLKSPNIHSRRSTKSAVDEFGFDRQSPCVQVSKGPLVHEGEESSSSAWGERSVDCYSRALEAPVYGQPDPQMQNSMDWMDEIFLNSLLEDDNGNTQNKSQSLNMPDSISRSQSFENFMSNMLTDPHSLMKDKDPTRREASVATSSLPLLSSDLSESMRRMEDSSPSFFMLDEYKRSAGSATDPDFTVLVPAELSVSNESEAVTFAEEPKCLEETVLQELEDITIHLSEKMRICFRDALYRLAKNSKEQHAMSLSRSTNFIERQSFMEVNNENPSLGRSQSGESRTNVVDRTIANLLFNEPYFQAPDFPCYGSLHSSTEGLTSSGSYYSSELPLQPQYYQGPT